MNFLLPFLLLPDIKELVEVAVDVQRMGNGILAKSLVTYTLDSRVV